MESVGLSLAIVSLSGLFTTFLDIRETISRIKTHERDYRRLACRLKLENVVLLKWGEAVGLLQNPNSMLAQQRYESHFAGRDDLDIVAEILIYLKEDFEDANDLLARYTSRHTHRPISEVVRINPRYRLHSASRAIGAGLRVLRTARSKTSLARRIHWALYGRAKLLELMKEITTSSKDLRQLIPTNGGPIETEHFHLQLPRNSGILATARIGNNLPGHSSGLES